MALTIYTYGGGDILRKVFDSLAILTSGGMFQSLVMIGLICGAFWAIVKCFFSPRLETFFLKFLLPALAVTSLLMLPRTKVHIEDAYTRAPYAVDNVPWLIAVPAEFISTLSYHITAAIETVMHVPNDMTYNKTGMVFGSETALDMRKYRLSNAVLEQNLKRFSKQCVFYDVALKKYSLDQLKKSTDLWKFLGENTSNVRMISYTDPLNPKKEDRYLSCKEAVKIMTPIFKKEKEYYASQDLVKHLPLTFQALTGIKKQSEELISQQLMMQLFDGELSSENFAKSRAYMQQKSTYHVLGALASTSLVTLRGILEALIYASVIIIIPLAVLPNGVSYVANWLWMLIWIHLWPPFYAITNYILQIIAQGRAKAIIAGLGDSEMGLSFFTNSGLATLYDDMFAMCGYLATLVPFIAYAVVKGGISSFMHLSSSLLSPGQSAASAAASEQATGNYSFANASYGQTSYENTSSLQHNLAPNLSSGHFTHNQGNISTTYTPDEALIRHNSSELRWGVSSDSALTESFQKSQQSADAYTESQQKSYSESLSSHGRWMSDFTSHLSQSQNYNDSFSEREAYDIQESARYLKGQSESLSKQYGISEHESMSMLLSGNVPLIGGASYGRNSTTDEAANTAYNISQTEDFQKNIQRINDFAKTSAHSTLTDEGMRIAEGTSRSFDEVKSTQEQYQVAKNHSEQISDTSSWAQQNSQLIRKALNQDMVNWATERLGFDEAKRVLTTGSNDEKSQLVNDFVQSLYFEGGFSNTPNPDALYQQAHMKSLDKDSLMNDLYQASYADAKSNGLERGVLNERKQEFETKISQAEDHFSTNLQNVKDKTSRGSDIEQYIEDKAPKQQEIRNLADLLYAPFDRGSDLALRLYDGPVNQVKLSDQYSDDKLPLGWEK
jgi:conjugal transfer mating pair stabilization protein TraG